ncbi:MAG: SEC-C metal-binding domain-containing protein, partial [Shewanella sp.]
PRCGGIAKFPDWHTDTTGKFHLDKIFSQVAKVKDTAKLSFVKESLEAANEDFTADDLVDALVELDSSFAQFKDTIRKLPAGTIISLVAMLFTFVSIVLTYQQVKVSEQALDSSNRFQQQQLDLARQQFEYQKQKDSNDLQQHKTADELEIEIQEMKQMFEEKLKHLELEAQPKDIKPKPLLKASQRNKPCPCGSGLKSKKCHPRGVA